MRSPRCSITFVLRDAVLASMLDKPARHNDPCATDVPEVELLDARGQAWLAEDGAALEEARRLL